MKPDVVVVIMLAFTAFGAAVNGMQGAIFGLVASGVICLTAAAVDYLGKRN